MHKSPAKEHTSFYKNIFVKHTRISIGRVHTKWFFLLIFRLMYETKPIRKMNNLNLNCDHLLLEAGTFPEKDDFHFR